MPLFEVSLILRTLTKVENKVVLKRAAMSILDEGAILRKIENLGTRRLPFRMKKDAKRYGQGSYFMFQFDARPELVYDLSDIYKRDIDIIRSYFSQVKQYELVECTLEEELLPPAYRPEVKAMMSQAKEKEHKKQFDMNVDIYPFQ